MKTKLLLVILLSATTFLIGTAQVPQGFNYQAIARDVTGNPITGKSVQARFSIQSSTAYIYWQEVHNPVTTNSFGLFTLVVGTGTRQIASNVATFSAMEWDKTPMYIKTEIKVEGDADYRNMGTTQLWSVPYSMVADSAKGLTKGSKLSVQGTGSETTGTALFEVKRKDGQTVFAVYPEGVRAYVEDGSKGAKGGFAVGGFGTDKAASPRLLYVDKDSVRIYIDPTPSAVKGATKGGFAVGGYDEAAKGYGGINTQYFNLTGASGVNVIPAGSSQILWYPIKNAFLAGNVHIGRADSVGNYSTALGYRSIAMGDYSQAFGYRARAYGKFSTSIGKNSIAGVFNSKHNSFALGNETQAIGEDSYAFGSGAKATGEKSFAFGSVAIDSSGHALSTPTTASGMFSTAIGMGAQATNTGSLAFGNGSSSGGYASLGLGFYSIASGNYSVSVGYYARATNTYAHTFGLKAQATGVGSLALGMYAYSSGSYAAALGRGANSGGGYSAAVGYYAQTPGLYSGAFGFNAIANGQSSVAVGYLASTLNTATGAGAFGNYARGNAPSSVAIGYYATTTGQYSGAFGYYSSAAGVNSVAVGSGAITGASATDAGAFGKGATANGQSSIAIGNGAIAGNTDAGAFGKAAVANGVSSIAIGNGATTGASATDASAFGKGANATGATSLALGNLAQSTGSISVAMGYDALASGQYSMALGYSTLSSNIASTSIGYNTEASGLYSMALGYNSIAYGTKSLALGSTYSYSYYRCRINRLTGEIICGTTTGNAPNTATGQYSAAIGNGNTAQYGGMAIGFRNTSIKSGAITLGYLNYADTTNAIAAGTESTSHGISAIALGQNVTAEAASSLVVGTYNATSTGYNKYSWVETDPLFVVGNGDATTGHDAFRINKNGATYINPENAYSGLWVSPKYDSNYGSTYAYGILSNMQRNKAGVTYYSGYFYDSGSGLGTYNGEYADVRTGASIDVAEYIYDTNANTGPADVVVADPNNKESIVKSSKPYQTGVLGVISTKPHMTMGMELVTDEKTGAPLENPKPTARLALSGRVPVNVCGENGAIKPGDYLTSSSTPGTAMKWTLLDVNGAKDFDDLKKILAENERRRGAIIGKAVESFAGSGTAKIMVLISLQ
jgi:hypothetical protein